MNSLSKEEFFQRFDIDIREGRLGGGAFGTVYKTWDNLKDEWKAVKIAEVKKIAKQTSVQGYIAATQGMQLRANKEATLQTVDKRLIIVSKKDTVLNYQSVIEEAARTKTPFIELPNGHMSYIEDNEVLISVLKKFIN